MAKKWLVMIRVTDDCDPLPLDEKIIIDMIKSDVGGHSSGVDVEVIKIEEEK